MNLKGGTGKTVTAINTGAILAHDHDQTVLLIDADSQANLTEFVSRNPADGCVIGGMTDLLKGLDATAVPSKLPGVRLLPGDEKLMTLDISAARSGIANPSALRDFLDKYDAEIDRCIIDCPPAFSASAMAALMAADDVVIPVKLDAFGIRGLARILEQVRNMRKVNPELEVAGVLPTMFYDTPEQRKALSKLQNSLKAAGIHCFYPIHRSVMVDDSTFAEEPLIKSSPRSKACQCYRRFVKELLAMEGGEQ